MFVRLQRGEGMCADVRDGDEGEPWAAGDAVVAVVGVVTERLDVCVFVSRRALLAQDRRRS
jgi:hypothetical protein